ncbi:MAG: hypothetical protein HY905_23060 [Deltaproteobacteria bacterium]|nr:hypothetical protein [Deltaproteobacteria bacterium]
MKPSLRIGAGLASLILVLCVAPTLVHHDAPARPSAPVSSRPAAEVVPASAAPAPAATPAPLLPEEPSQTCAGVPARAIAFSFPFQPRAGEAVRLVAVSREQLAPFVTELSGPEDAVTLEPSDQWGPGPFGSEFRTGALAAGDYAVTLRDPVAGTILGCSSLRVLPAGPARERTADGDGVWPIRRAWSGALEDLYSVWVSRLFRTPGDSRAAWHRLHAVFRDPARNVLYGALGWDEDDTGTADNPRPTAVRARADCGDLPYMLRAYFAWKFELPFRFQRCNRRNALQGAECYEERSNLTERYRGKTDPVERFNRFLETWVVVGVHSATPRTLPEDDDSDFYPIEMSRSALRPGTVYVWPYGHLLVITDWIEDDTGGVSLVAVDGHLDGTVTFKHFSPKNFPYLPGLRTFGFKTFRPLVYAGGEILPVDNAGIAAAEVPLVFSEEQYRFRRSRDFYRAVWHVSALVPDGPPGS